MTRIRIPVRAERRCAYRKLRQRLAVDFPLLTVAVAADFRSDGSVAGVRGAVTGLGSRPRWLTGWDEVSEGGLDDEVVDALAQRAWAQCHPLENMIVDAEWRRAMVPVEVGRALRALRDAAPAAAG